MGNALTFEHMFNPHLAIREPDTTPKTMSDPTFDPHLGFDYQRKEREKKWDDKEAEALRVNPKYRDFCAEYFIEYAKCRGKEFPYLWRCHHEKHAITHCYAKDQELRVREWERERRLRIRQKKLDEQQAIEAIEAN